MERLDWHEQKAGNLRSEGFSINEISEKLGVAKSSVSVWVRDVVVPKDKKKPARRNYQVSALKFQEHFREKRRKAQDAGKMRIKIIEPNSFDLYIAGCMLYWGEGSKSRNHVAIANSDPYLIRLFKKFLMKYFDVQPDDISLSVNVYLDNGLSLKEIQDFWLDFLDLPYACFRKCQVNCYPTANSELSKKKGKLPFGTCTLSVCNVDIVQEIYGAIKEFADIQGDTWLD